MSASPAHPWISNKQNELNIVRVHWWCGWHLWSCSLSALALSHALLAFSFCSTRLQSIASSGAAAPEHELAEQAIHVSSAQQTCSCSLHLCGSLGWPVVAGNRVPENAECCSLLQMAKTDVMPRVTCVGTYEQQLGESVHAPARRQTSVGRAGQRLQHGAL